MKSDALCVHLFLRFPSGPRYLNAQRTWRKENGWNGRSGKASESIGHREWNVDPFFSPCFGSHTNYIIRNFTHLIVFLLNERVAFWRQQRRSTYVHKTAPAPYSGCALLGIDGEIGSGFFALGKSVAGGLVTRDWEVLGIRRSEELGIRSGGRGAQSLEAFQFFLYC